MNYDLVLCGVGGQGVLSIAWVIDHAAHEAGLHFKQSEVHGMAQRGGAVSAFVRISDQPVASDLIATGAASLVLSMEPMEALRYTQLLRPDGWIVTDVTPLENDAYPKHEALYKVLFSVPRLVALDATRLAQKAGTVKAQNMVVLGAAAAQLPLPTELLEAQVQELFASKGERIVKANINAFRIGAAASGFATAMLAAGVPSTVLARVLPRLAFEPQPVPQAGVDAWCSRLLAADGAQTALRLFEAGAALAPESVPA
ncbi:MAG: indolepyruvate oxidoreductase subunit beta [Rhodoferax sp.]